MIGRRFAAAMVATVGLALLAAGCGGGSSAYVAELGSTNPTRSGTHATPKDKYAAALAYSRCMRSHGVVTFPDPTQSGGGIQISGSRSGMNPQTPLFESAQQSCRHLLSGQGRPPHSDPQQALARMLHASRCMRARGIPGFPDPTLSPPSDRAGYSAIMSNGGAWLAIPNSIDVGSPPFGRAATACNLSVG